MIGNDVANMFSRLFALGAVLFLSIGVPACSWHRTLGAAGTTPDTWQAGQILEVATGQVVAYDDWLESLRKYDIVYFGEEHYNRHHIDNALRVLNDLAQRDVRPAIGMEMFGWDGQSALDHYVSHPQQSRQDFLEQVQWKSNWGGAFDNYEPLVNYARAQHRQIYGLNPPKALIRQVVKSGLSQAREGPDWKHWKMDGEEIVDDPAYRTRIFDQLRRCHGGGAEDDYRTMYEASMVRDEGMARTLVSALETAGSGPVVPKPAIVSYTGGGHIQYNLPVPARVSRRLSGQIRQTTIYMTAFDATRVEDIRELVRDRIADYLWLTPVNEQGPVQRCR